MCSTFIYFVLHLNSKRNQEKIFLCHYVEQLVFLKKPFAAYRNQYVNFIKVTSEPSQACYFWGQFWQGELQKLALILVESVLKKTRHSKIYLRCTYNVHGDFFYNSISSAFCICVSKTADLVRATMIENGLG